MQQLVCRCHTHSSR
uniref:Uncharacterized protein n=1 Tax=Anguilla anguilla TaxID=7936 RepID=A0A0E9RL73_ANGAN